MFWLKKILSLLIMPIPAVLLLLLFALLCWRRAYLGRVLVGASMVLLLMMSSVVGSQWLLAPLEGRYSINSSPIEGRCLVVVLGSSHEDEISGTAVQQLSPVALSRLIEGQRQLSLGEDCHLVVSGFDGGLNQTPHAEVMKRAAIELGVVPGQILTLPLARDTVEEAQQLYTLASGARVRLVTSAAHMPRAMIIFAHQGIAAEAAPTDFTARRDHWWRLDARALYASQRAIHEYVGRLWLLLRYGA